MRKSLLPAGIILSVIGGLFILYKLGMLILDYFWPLAVLAVGLLLRKMFFRNTLPAIVLLPATALIISSPVLLYGNWFGWDSMKYLWPLFLLSVSVGTYQYYRYDATVDRMFHTISVSLGVVAVIALCVTLYIKLSFIFVALLLVAVGVFLIRRARR